jgi:3,4-dihydroxy 2-butanone 4-phosphate synthase/GTP cyclohydrolase II
VPTHVTRENLGYLRTKRDRMGHLLDIIEPPASLEEAAGPVAAPAPVPAPAGEQEEIP